MNKLLIVLILLIVLGGAGYWYFKMRPQMSSSNVEQNNSQSEQVEQKADADVNIQNFAFGPSVVTIKVGQTIKWTNNDSVQHSATSDDSSWYTGILNPGESKILTFNKVGSFTYTCSLHPNMKGSVIVTDK